MTVSEVSEMILNDNFGLEIAHSEEVDPAPSDNFIDDQSNAIDHYGILGMKWGVRRSPEELGHKTPKRKKKDRRYEDESDQEYQARMQRELTERQSNASAKTQQQMQKRQLKSQERQQKRQLKSQADQQDKQRKLQERQQRNQEKRQERQEKQQEKQLKKLAKQEKQKTKSKPVNPRSMTDRELKDAIQRLRDEQTYKQLSLENKALPKKTLIKAASISGGILLAVGTAVVKKQLTDLGNMKAEEYLKKKGIDLSKVKGKKGVTEDRVREIFEELSGKD